MIDWIEASNLEDETHEDWTTLKSADGILVPGGFGDRGIEGKILAAKYARTHKVPYLGICLGLQIATIEFCNVLGKKCKLLNLMNQPVWYSCLVQRHILGHDDWVAGQQYSKSMTAKQNGSW